MHLWTFHGGQPCALALSWGPIMRSRIFHGSQSFHGGCALVIFAGTSLTPSHFHEGQSCILALIMRLHTFYGCQSRAFTLFVGANHAPSHLSWGPITRLHTFRGGQSRAFTPFMGANHAPSHLSWGPITCLRTFRGGQTCAFTLFVGVKHVPSYFCGGQSRAFALFMGANHAPS
jgi:hypothetical protein